MPTRRKRVLDNFRATLLVSIIILIPVCLINVLQVYHSTQLFPVFEPSKPPRIGITCVKAMGNNTVESLGELVSRNQLAFFIANLYHARISFPSLNGTAKDLKKLFTNCLMPHPACIIRHKQVGFLQCPMGDCGCLSRKLSKHLHPLATCSVLGVENMGWNLIEYSGCLRGVLRRYFGQPSRWPRPYDAVHFIDGTYEPDVGKIIDGRMFSPNRFRHVMHALCVLSDRDIIVVTEEGTPKIPLCENRTVLANVTMFQAMKIMEHARHISVGSNALGKLMMEMATPERAVLASEVQNRFLWLKIPDITLLRRDGHMFHFSGREILGDIEMELEKKNFDSEPIDILTEPKVPPRRWESEAEAF